MSKILKSGQKIECVNGLVQATSAFLADLQDKGNALKVSTEAIALQRVDKFHNQLIGASIAANDLAEQLSDTLVQLCSVWGSRPGMAANAVEAFEEAKTKAGSIKASMFTASPVELSDDLHENFTDETSSAFKKALTDYCATKDAYITAVTNAIMEYQTEDTQEAFTSIGIGIETFCNALVDAFDENKKSLADLELGLEELAEATKKSTNVVADAGSNASKTIAAGEEGLN